MPYVKEWENPEEVFRYKGVVVHRYYLDEDEEEPEDFEYAIYAPGGSEDGEPWFGCLEGAKPEQVIDIRHVCEYVGLTPKAGLATILTRLVDCGLLTQDGFDEAKTRCWEPPDTLTIPLPFDELKEAIV